MALAGGKVNFAGQWNTLWKAVESVIGSQGTTLMAVIGLAMVVAAVAKWVWDRRKGGGGGGNAGLIWVIVVGGLLAAPTVIFPLLLTIVDWLINAGISVFNSAK